MKYCICKDFSYTEILVHLHLVHFHTKKSKLPLLKQMNLKLRKTTNLPLPDFSYSESILYFISINSLRSAFPRPQLLMLNV